jgi:hypothetical protein
MANAEEALGARWREGRGGTWNTADVWNGLAAMLPGVFRESPLNLRRLSFGTFAMPSGRIAPLGVRYTVLEGGAGNGQLLALLGGATGRDGFRVVVRRLE